ncbi:hypothetical protein PPERSA_09348 [Pseudocohnilembus persalinus]|uniref:Uncharacterized protein n=1 Tax=Pseudocohnilembus persalinus TaxID=266149 RepID=A0A0V0QY55_PSEPJ|nr:hypothetical protein PPERSA_09348 [Pseudocohnilembus persalinus]|eukprot:KRX07134.1 hypothetical protein PPERSA_09348 [Pseudocohnilembus persalinus]
MHRVSQSCLDKKQIDCFYCLNYICCLDHCCKWQQCDCNDCQYCGNKLQKNLLNQEEILYIKSYLEENQLQEKEKLNLQNINSQQIDQNQNEKQLELVDNDQIEDQLQLQAEEIFKQNNKWHMKNKSIENQFCAQQQYKQEVITKDDIKQNALLLQEKYIENLFKNLQQEEFISNENREKQTEPHIEQTNSNIQNNNNNLQNDNLIKQQKKNEQNQQQTKEQLIQQEEKQKNDLIKNYKNYKNLKPSKKKADINVNGELDTQDLANLKKKLQQMTQNLSQNNGNIQNMELNYETILRLQEQTERQIKKVDSALSDVNKNLNDVKKTSKDYNEFSESKDDDYLMIPEISNLENVMDKIQDKNKIVFITGQILEKQNKQWLHDLSQQYFNVEQEILSKKFIDKNPQIFEQWILEQQLQIRSSDQEIVQLIQKIAKKFNAQNKKLDLLTTSFTGLYNEIECNSNQVIEIFGNIHKSRCENIKCEHSNTMIFQASLNQNNELNQICYNCKEKSLRPQLLLKEEKINDKFYQKNLIQQKINDAEIVIMAGLDINNEFISQILADIISKKVCIIEINEQPQLQIGDVMQLVGNELENLKSLCQKILQL